MADAVETARHYDDAFNSQDPDARRALSAPEIEVVIPGGMTLVGPEQVAQVVQAFWEALPDGKIIHHDVVAAGETVVTEGVLTGTHAGTFRSPQGEIAPTGNRVELRYASVRRIQEGRVAWEHLYFDQLEFLQQLDALPTG
jgi:predicted ester cyclase